MCFKKILLQGKYNRSNTLYTNHVKKEQLSFHHFLSNFSYLYPWGCFNLEQNCIHKTIKNTWLTWPSSTLKSNNGWIYERGQKGRSLNWKEIAKSNKIKWFNQDKQVSLNKSITPWSNHTTRLPTSDAGTSGQFDTGTLSPSLDQSVLDSWRVGNLRRL